MHSKVTYFRLITLLIGVLLISAHAFGQGSPSVPKNENRGRFKPTTTRESLFDFERQSRSSKDRDISVRTLNLGDMLNRHIKPTGYVTDSFTKNGKVLLQNRFISKGDLIRVQVTEGADNYEEPSVELVVSEVTDSYIEFLREDTKQTSPQPLRNKHRVNYNLSPKLTTQSTNKISSEGGVNIEYLGSGNRPRFLDR